MNTIKKVKISIFLFVIFYFALLNTITDRVSAQGNPVCNWESHRECLCYDRDNCRGGGNSGCTNRYRRVCEVGAPITGNNNGEIIYRYIYDSNGNWQLDDFDFSGGVPPVDTVLDQNRVMSPGYASCNSPLQVLGGVSIVESLLNVNPFGAWQRSTQVINYPNACDNLDRAYSNSIIGSSTISFQNVGFEVYDGHKLISVSYGLNGAGEEVCSPRFEWWSDTRAAILCNRNDIPPYPSNQVFILVGNGTPPTDSCSATTTASSPLEVLPGNTASVGTNFTSIAPLGVAAEIRYSLTDTTKFSIVGPNTTFVRPEPSGTTALSNYYSSVEVQPVTTANPGDSSQLIAEVYINGVSRCSSITNLQVGQPLYKWWQVVGGNLISASGNVSSNVAGTAKMIPTDYFGMPIFTGSLVKPDTVANLSTAGWRVDSATFAHRTAGDTNYDYSYFWNKFHPTEPDAEIGGGVFNNSNITAANAGEINNGYQIFHKSGDLTVNTVDLSIIPGSQKVILFVDGNVTLSAITKLTKGIDFFMLVATGDISVDTAVGAAAAADYAASTPDLEGIFITNKAFKTGESPLGSASKQLHIRGIIIGFGTADSAGGIGIPGTNDGISLDRDLLAENTFPTEIFEFAPDQLMLFPSFFSERSITWKEVVP